MVRLTVSGVAGNGSYVQLRRNGPTGEVVFEGTVANGSRRTWTSRRPLWMRLGWTPSVQVRVGGHAATAEGGTANFIVTRAGLQPAA
jgi:hypothetical protein